LEGGTHFLPTGEVSTRGPGKFRGGLFNIFPFWEHFLHGGIYFISMGVGEREGILFFDPRGFNEL